MSQVEESLGSTGREPVVGQADDGSRGLPESVEDQRRLFSVFFEHAPTAFQIFRADGRSVLVNQAFRDLFGSEPPPEYNVLQDDIAQRQGFLALIQRAFAGEVVHVPAQWYDPRDLRDITVHEGRRVAIELTLFPLRDACGVVRHVAHCCKDVTAEQTLALERAEIDATLNSIGDAVIATDDTGRVVRMNPVAERLTGWSLPQARGTPLADVFRIFNEETRVPVESPADRVLREGSVVGLANHTILVARDGAQYPIADSGAPIRDASGVVRGVVLVFHDKTEDAKAERALRASEERLRLLNDLGEATRVVADPEQIMPVALAVLGRHLGVSRCAWAHVEEDGDSFTIPHDYTDGCPSIVGHYQLSLFGPRAVAELRQGRTLVVRNVDTELSRDEGATTFNAINSKAIICCSLVRHGVFRAMMAVHQITPRDWTDSEIALVQEVVERCWATIEQRVAEAKLRHSEALLRIAGHTAHLGGWRIEVPSLRLTWSDEMRPIHDLPAGTTPGLEQGIQYYLPEYRDIVRTKLRDCASEGTPFDLELQLLTAIGRRIWVRAIGQAERNLAGTIVAVRGALQEITERKQTESQLLVSDRMASVGSLAAGVAHEINNPLASLAANLALADQEITDLSARVPVSPELLNELRDAREGAERVRMIVRDLQLFSHSEQDRSGPVDVEQALESTMRLAWNEVRHRARIVRVYGKVPLVEANEARLGQVFLNLIVNAAQSIPEGNCEGNEIRLETAIGPGNRVTISIADTGSGMTAEVQHRLFTPFLTTKPVGVGTGLGLSICHRLVTTMGGALAFSSEVGRGTVFRVVLPIAQPRAKAERVAPVMTPPAVSRRGRVLVIDDEVVLAHTVRRILGESHDVVPIDSAQEALVLFRSGQRFDVIFCDLMMPQVSGMDLHAELSRIEPDQAQKMVFMTGGAFTPRARDFLATVSNRRIEKPFNIQGMRSLVADLLRQA
jgi:PAS domain S-box-containing protein